MKVIVWGINYTPEVTGIGPFNAALCNFLRRRGDDVRMIASFPYYPAWEKAMADRHILYRTDDVDGVKVHRCWHYIPGPQKPSARTRILHDASFVLTSFLRLIVLKRPDVYVVVSPPLLLGLAAWWLSVLKRAPFVFHVQDLQVDAAVHLSMLKSGLLKRMLYGLEAVAYRRAGRVSGISHGMLAAFAEKGVPASKVVHFPNSAALLPADALPARGRFRARHGFSDDDFLAVYSGNLGAKQGLDVLLQAAPEIRSARVRLIICGGGTMRDEVASRIASCRLENVWLLPLQADEQYREMMVDADVALITQRRGAAAIFFPSKLLSSVAFAKPILAVADAGSELAGALVQGGCGVRVDPDDPRALARMLESLSENPMLLKRLSEGGRDYVKQFEVNVVMASFADELGRLVRGA